MVKIEMRIEIGDKEAEEEMSVQGVSFRKWQAMPDSRASLRFIASPVFSFGLAFQLKKRR